MRRIETVLWKAGSIFLMAAGIIVGAHGIEVGDGAALGFGIVSIATGLILWYEPERLMKLVARRPAVYHGHPMSQAVPTPLKPLPDATSVSLASLFTGYDATVLAGIRTRVRGHRHDPSEYTDINLIDMTGADDPWRARADREWLDAFIGRVRNLLEEEETP